MVALQTVACGLHMTNCITVRLGTDTRRLCALDGFPASTICWRHPSQPSLINQCEVPGNEYIVLRN
eukprot:7323937-Lingulodinium_polyedra.AAC.1